MENKKRESARAIIIENGEAVLMFRKKKNEFEKFSEYYVCPGGGVEPEETLEETLVRELKEELSIDIKPIKFIGRDENDKTIANFFQCEIIKGEPVLGGEELGRAKNDNYYEIRKVKITDLEDKTVYGLEMIMKAYNNR